MISLHVSHAKRKGGGGGEVKITRQTEKKDRYSRTTAIVFKIGEAGGCFSLSLTTNNRDLYSDCFQCGPKKMCLIDNTLFICVKGVADRSRKRVV